jgi:predicted DCC family thiol-disulfide oxidoreductase YuxK
MKDNTFNEWVFYDSECPMCSNLTHNAKKLTAGQGLGFASLHSDWVKEKIKDVKEPLKEMLILKPDGNIIGGADAMVHLARKIWFTRPIYWIYQIPGMKFVYKPVYAFIAKNRYCISKVCRIKPVGEG